jgi:RNA polymerase sigma-70 factor (ECF subfamily)
MSYNKPSTSSQYLSLDKSNQISESELIQLLQERKRKGFEILYDNYAPVLLGVISRIIRNKETAEDILSETFIKIANSFQQYDASKGRLFTWMINIARNLSIDKLRSKEYRNTLNTSSFDSQAADLNRKFTTSINPVHSDIKLITASLDPAYKTLIDLAFFKGYTHVEIAEELQLPLGTVKTRIRKAISCLRQLFDYTKISDIPA